MDYVVPLAVRATTRQDDDAAIDEEPDLDGWLQTYTPQELRQEQTVDPVLQALQHWAEEGKPDKASVALEDPALKRYWLSWPQVTMEQGVLNYR